MLLTDRDNLFLSFIEDYGSLTARQASELFFEGSYESARRRLKYYKDIGRLSYYTSSYNKEKVYYSDEEKKLSPHYLFVVDYICYLKKRGCKIKKIIFHPEYLERKIKPDAFVSFEYNGFLYLTLLEVDYTHYTDNIKFKKYEQLYFKKDEVEEFMGQFPAIVVARTRPSIRYSSKYLEIIYTNLQFDKVDTFLLN